ncbi:MAG TPA: hypothetical protein VEI98_06660 [Xanthobacteraceae bacterium]|nr:hypothetical protein [Xanthobacteraceae bacterium]
MSAWFGLSDDQLATVVTAAGKLSIEKRETFLQRLAARLQQRGRFGDADVDDAIRGALVGLVHSSAA